MKKKAEEKKPEEQGAQQPQAQPLPFNLALMLNAYDLVAATAQIAAQQLERAGEPAGAMKLQLTAQEVLKYSRHRLERFNAPRIVEG